MRNILDLRFIIGAFFLLVGIFLVIGSLVMQPGPDKTETVNRWSGIVYIVFSIVMLLLWKLDKTPSGDMED
jgi:uncharacterized membrane protein HdeD (DUF308 family)